jgi:probable HAF family extracellular repeat protein
MQGSRRTLARAVILAATVMVGGVGPMATVQAQAGVPRPYRTVDLGFEGQSTAINDRRQVVGGIMLGTGFDVRRHPFLWERGRHIDLGVLVTGSFEHGLANDINNRGQVVGQSAVEPGVDHAFLWERGVMTDLGTLGGEWSAATRINDRGQIIGLSQNSAGEWRSFLWQNGVMTDLGPGGFNDINNRGQIVGWRWFGDVASAVRLERGQLARLDSRMSSAAAVNDSGTVVGHLSYDDTETSEAYLWRAGRAVNIGGPVRSTVAVDINDHGEVLIQTINGLALWRNGVLTPLPEIDVTVTGVNAAALNNRGDIVASRTDLLEPDIHATVYLR